MTFLMRMFALLVALVFVVGILATIWAVLIPLAIVATIIGGLAFFGAFAVSVFRGT